MSQQRSVTHSTFVIERSYSVTPERVFAAFSDPAKKRRWFAGAETRSAKKFEMDFRVGGRDHASYRMSESSPFPGVVLSNDTTYQDIVPNRRIVIAYTMTLGENRISSSLATFELLATEKGTNLIFTDQGAYFEGSDGPKMREGGWQQLLESLGSELER